MTEVIPRKELKRRIKKRWGGDKKRNKFEKMLRDCIDQLSSDEVDAGVDLISDIAKYCKTAGTSRHAFVEMMMYVEQEAVKKSDEQFVQMKIRAALKAKQKIIHQWRGQPNTTMQS